MTDYLKIEYETTLRDIDAALAEFHIELPGGGAAHRDHGVHLLVEQLRRAEAEVERLQATNRALLIAVDNIKRLAHAGTVCQPGTCEECDLLRELRDMAQVAIEEVEAAE